MENLSLNKLLTLLGEAPINDINLIGNWEDNDRPRGYDKPSIAMLKNPNYLEKIKHKWRNTEEDYDIYLLRSKEGNKYTEVGEIDEDFIKNKLHIDLQIDPNHITIIFTNNKGVEKVPLTPWIMAHRFGHALARKSGRRESEGDYDNIYKQVEQLLAYVQRKLYPNSVSRDDNIYNAGYFVRREKYFLHIANALGTMKSARERKLRASFELTNELIAQYIVTGKIQLNSDYAKYPKVLPTRYAWGNPVGPWKTRLDDSDKEIFKNSIEGWEARIETDIALLLESAVGRIFLM